MSDDMHMPATAASSAEIDKLATALAKAQGAFLPITKDRVNPHFKSKYATLDALQTATRKALSDNGLALVQVIQSNGRVELSTRLIHSSGQWLASNVQLSKLPAGPQPFGSELTYLRRYSYAAMLSISADEDDDANDAQADHTARSAQKAHVAAAQRQQSQPASPQPQGLSPAARELAAKLAAKPAIEQKKQEPASPWRVLREGKDDFVAAARDEWIDFWNKAADRARDAGNIAALNALAKHNAPIFRALKDMDYGSAVEEVTAVLEAVQSAPSKAA